MRYEKSLISMAPKTQPVYYKVVYTIGLHSVNRSELARDCVDAQLPFVLRLVEHQHDRQAAG